MVEWLPQHLRKNVGTRRHGGLQTAALPDHSRSTSFVSTLILHVDRKRRLFNFLQLDTSCECRQRLLPRSLLCRDCHAQTLHVEREWRTARRSRPHHMEEESPNQAFQAIATKVLADLSILTYESGPSLPKIVEGTTTHFPRVYVHGYRGMPRCRYSGSCRSLASTLRF